MNIESHGIFLLLYGRFIVNIGSHHTAVEQHSRTSRCSG